MSANSLSVPFPIFNDVDGDPLDNGYIYIGTANLDPETNPIQVYFDSALTVPAPQPIRTINGFPSNSGAPARLYVDADDYSMTVRNKNESLIYTSLSDTKKIPAASISGLVSSLVSFTQDGVGATSRTVEGKLREIVSVLDFGADPTGVFDSTSAIQSAINTGKRVYLPGGTYKITSTFSSTSDLVMFGDGDQTVIDASDSLFTGGYVIDVQGQLTQVEDLTGSVSKGGLTLTSVSASSLVSDDIFVIYNPTDSSYSPWRTNYREGEFCEVRTVSGTTITLKSPLYSGYTAANVDVYKLTSGVVDLQDFKIIGDVSVGLVFAEHIRKPIIKNITMSHSNNSCLYLARCVQGIIHGCNIDNEGDGGDDYGISIGNSQSMTITDCNVYAARHATATGGDAQVGCVPCRDIHFRGCMLRNDISRGTHCADFHGNTEFSSYENCTIYQGCSLQGKNNVFRGCTIHSFLNGLVILTAEPVGGSLGIVDCDIYCGGNPKSVGRGIFDIGGNSSVLTTNLTEDITFFADSCRLYADALTSSSYFCRMRNEGATVKTNVRITGLQANVNDALAVLLCGVSSGTAAADFIVVDDISGFPAGTYLASLSGGYEVLPLRMMEQRGSESVTTNTGSSTVTGTPVTFHYAYPKTPTITSSRNDRGYAGNRIGIAYASVSSALGLTPSISVDDATNFAAAVSVTLAWSAAISEV
jgi:hypothetical protein